MRTFLLLLSITLSAPPSHAPSKAPTFLVQGLATRVHLTSPCRGGVQVTPEMVHSEAAPLAGQPLTVFAGQALTGKVVVHLMTDAQGQFSTRLAPGEYCLALGNLESLRIPDAGPPSLQPSSATADPHLDAECLQRLAHPTPTCHGRVVVTDRDQAGVQAVISSSNQCPQPWAQPCYRGPMPP